MAHRANLIQVDKKFPSSTDASATVHDPNCGKQLDRKTARFMLFRGETTYYFCSKECQEQFIHPSKHKQAA